MSQKIGEGEKCPKCDGEYVTAKFKGIDDPMSKRLGGLGALMGTGIGAIVEMRCLKCGHSERRTESYTG